MLAIFSLLHSSGMLCWYLSVIWETHPSHITDFFWQFMTFCSFYARNGVKKGVLSNVKLPYGNCIECNASSFDGRQCDLSIV